MKNSIILKNIQEKIDNSKTEVFIAGATSIVYSFLWFINPGNKIIAVSFLFLIIIFLYKLKDIRLSLLLAYLASFIIFTGKKYVIQLVPPGVYPLEIYPIGYVVNLVISPKHILAGLMAVFLFRDFIVNKISLSKLGFKDILIFLFFSWLIVSDVVASERLAVSLPFSLLSLEWLILYLYLRFYYVKNSRLVLYLLWLFASLVFVESFVSLLEFIGSSPVIKNIEAQLEFVQFGQATDELLFRFRPSGTFGHPNYLGMWLSFFLSLFLAIIIKFPKKVFLAAFTAGMASLAMSLSRSAWLGLTVSSLATLYILEKVKKIKITIPPIISRNFVGYAIIAIFLVIFFILPRAEKSIYIFSKGGAYLRFLLVEENIQLIKQNPLFGVGSQMSVPEGLNANPSGILERDALIPHNWFLLIAVEHGIPAAIFFLAFVILSTREIWLDILKARMDRLGDYFRIGAVSAFLSMLIISLFQPFIGIGLILLSLGILGSERK